MQVVKEPEPKFIYALEFTMGTEENDSEPAGKEQGSPETVKESSVEQTQTSETTDPLNTYKWHTGSKGALNDREDGDGATTSSTSTIDKIQKASSNKWSKMQSWRKALSEDPGDKNSSSSGKTAEGPKPDKGAGGTRKNPFRRALSEPPGSLFAALTPSSSSANAASSSSSSAAAEASVGSSTDPSQKGGGGAIFKKYLWNVTQKLKRPRLQSRNSALNLLPGKSAVTINNS